MAPMMIETDMSSMPGTFTQSPGPQSPVDNPRPTSRPATPKTHAAPVSPITPKDVEARMSTASMSSIALSESSLDYDHLSPEQVDDVLATPRIKTNTRHLRKPSSLEILQNVWSEPHRQSTFFDAANEQPPETPIDEPNEEDVWRDSAEIVTAEAVSMRSASSTSAPSVLHTRSSTAESRSSSNYSQATPRRMSSSSGEPEVDWSQLDKNEEQEKEDKDLSPGAEDESTAFLLARLEQENAKFSADPKSSTPSLHKSVQRVRSESRPPSMGHLKMLVSDRNAPSIRYSLAPDMPLPEEPPPMTELEFWAALVQDYPSTAVRLPTLTTTKIRSGIPPPLRGVVWASMSGARDRSLDASYEKLVGEKSPYEGIINKDVGRSFPGVELFRDAEGEGQQMLGRVLKCFSLHDKDIGYCQGLGFLVGPLLMNMGEKEAFCVLVRLMDHYALRPSFLPSLSGLHMRIFQFSNLLKQHQPTLSAHLAQMGVEPAYLSQWFLSSFAVTCPLPMLFRIYDVIFAEGANETVMRVAIALMRRNEATMLATTEFEEVMQLLLGRGIWDCYAFNADDLVDDFTSLGEVVTHTRLAELEKEFESQSSESVGQSAGFLPDVQAAASRFLGRLWAPVGNGTGHAHTPSKSTSLSPQSAEKDGATAHARTGSFLRKSSSKQSISTINESTGSESSTSSTASTAPTEVDPRESTTADSMSLKSKPESVYPQTPGLSKEERDAHGQIEDLLTALSEMQREQQQLAALLQIEREERGEDQRCLRTLVKNVRKGGDESGEGEEEATKMDERRRTMPPPARRKDEENLVKQRPKSVMLSSVAGRQNEDLDELLERVTERLNTNKRLSASFETKAQLRSTLARTREQLTTAEQQSRELSTRLENAETSVAAFTSESEDLRTEVRELRVRVNEEFKAKQKLEHSLRELKAEARSIERKDRQRVQRADSLNEVPNTTTATTASRSDSASPVGRRGSVSSAPVSMVGLRELKLGRRDSSSSPQSARALRRQTVAFAQSSIAHEKPEIHVQTSQLSTAPEQSVASESASPSESSYEPASAVAETPASALSLPPTAAFGARTSSLATKEVLATPEHEVVPEEALLLELVNAKTAEAQARQEVDELRRALALSARRHEAAILQVQAQTASARAEAANAMADAEAARIEAENAKADAAANLRSGTPSLSVPTTPAAYDSDARSLGDYVGSTPSSSVERRGSKKADSPGGGGAGWFWSRRTASTTKAVLTPPGIEEQKEVA